ncbi:O-succinylbenzoic acid-CoA ligase [Cutibacterium acnes JCM 18918]|nr:O-succinylbenzoic acid-CoA ligase [Cutibacterium acnes JCM 18918]
MAGHPGSRALAEWAPGHRRAHRRRHQLGRLKIAAGQVLDQIRATGMVRDGLVLGLADATWGQVVTAVVVPGRGWRGPERCATSSDDVWDAPMLRGSSLRSTSCRCCRRARSTE